jgi:hypothetical protein
VSDSGAELDRRYPERVQRRQMHTPDEFRAMWHTLEQLWRQTVNQFTQLPEALRHQRVNGEWSFVETLRHLIFATDAWVGRTVLDHPVPYHRFGLPHSELSVADAMSIGLDVTACPSFGEVVRVREDRLTVVRDVVDRMTDDALERLCARAPTPDFPEERHTVRTCLRTVMNEECEHRRYAVRDLAVLVAGTR